MYNDLLPIAPGHFVVIDRYEGLNSGAVVYVYDTADEAAQSVADSLVDISRAGEIDPIDLELDYDYTWMVSVEMFRS